MFSEGDAGDVKNVALEPLFVFPDQAGSGHVRGRSDAFRLNGLVGDCTQSAASSFVNTSHGS